MNSNLMKNALIATLSVSLCACVVAPPYQPLGYRMTSSQLPTYVNGQYIGIQSSSYVPTISAATPAPPPAPANTPSTVPNVVTPTATPSPAPVYLQSTTPSVVYVQAPTPVYGYDPYYPPAYSTYPYPYPYYSPFYISPWFGGIGIGIGGRVRIRVH